MLRRVICGPEVSMDFPMIGKTIEVATKPAPPKIDIPRAPLLGTYSDATPIIVGQKYKLLQRIQQQRVLSW